MPHITVTVNHNDDELALEVDGKTINTVKTSASMGVQSFLDALLESIDLAHFEGGPVFMTLESINEDRRKTVNEW